MPANRTNRADDLTRSDINAVQMGGAKGIRTPDLLTARAIHAVADGAVSVASADDLHLLVVHDRPPGAGSSGGLHFLANPPRVLQRVPTSPARPILSIRREQVAAGTCHVVRPLRFAPADVATGPRDRQPSALIARPFDPGTGPLTLHLNQDQPGFRLACPYSRSRHHKTWGCTDDLDRARWEGGRGGHAGPDQRRLWW